VPNNKSYDDELELLMSFLAESVAQMDDSQIKEEYGNGPKPRTKEILRAELSNLRKQKLRKARIEYESATRSLSSQSNDLPHSSSEQRAILSRILGRQPGLASLALTAQHRELRDLSDSDVESFLKQLAALGLLDSFLEGK
jgi:hypothetical protein